VNKQVASGSVVIAGGGVIGLACALECRLRGAKVTLVEKGRCGGQASGAAAGMLAPYSENSEYPDPFYKLCQDSLALYEEWLQLIGEYSNTDPEYRQTGSLNVVFHGADVEPMKRRINWQQATGTRAEWVEENDLRRLEPALASDVKGAILYPDEAHLYAPAYVTALEEACRMAGVDILDHAGEIVLQKKDGEFLLTGGSLPHPVSGDRLVIATGAWAEEWQEACGAIWPVVPIRGQICAFPIVAGEVRHMVFGSQGYVVAKANGSLVCGASEDVAGFDTSVTEAGIARLERWSRQLIPNLDGRPILLKWAGLRPATRDGWPLIGPVRGAEQVICAFGHYRNGILLAPVTAKRIGDWLEGRAIPGYMEAFDPMRFTIYD